MLSSIGSWMQTVAVGVLVTQQTGKAQWTALVAAAAFFPQVIFTPLGGAAADRFDRRWLLILTNFGQASCAITLALLYASGQLSPAVAITVVLLDGSFNAFGMPSFFVSLPDLAGRSHIVAALSLSSAQWNLGRVLGPSIGVVVIAVAGYSWVFVINALSFFAVITAMSLVYLPRPSPKRGQHLLRQLATGAKAIATIPGCRSGVIIFGMIAFAVAPYIALVPAVAQLLFHGNARTTAFLVVSQGIGAVIGAFVLPGLAHRYGRHRILVGDIVALPIAFIAYALAPSVIVAACLIAILAAIHVGTLSGLNTVAQLHAPPLVRARVVSLYTMTLGLSYSLGSTVLGGIADRVGLRAAMLIGAGVFSSFLIVNLLLHTTTLKDLADPSEPSAEKT